MHNYKSLAMRDPALAALTGAISGSDFGAEFEGDDDFGEDFSDAFGADDEDDFGVDTEFSGAPSLASAIGNLSARVKPSPKAAQLAAWKALASRTKAQSATKRRYSLLSPNADSKVKIERYVFALSQTITFGTASSLDDLSGQPDCTIRPQRFTTNAPQPMFATISDIKLANVSVSIGGGSMDAYQFNANGQGQMMDLPTLSPSQRARVIGAYTGLIPTGVVTASQPTGILSATFIGPATLAG